MKKTIVDPLILSLASFAQNSYIPSICMLVVCLAFPVTFASSGMYTSMSNESLLSWTVIVCVSFATMVFCLVFSECVFIDNLIFAKEETDFDVKDALLIISGVVLWIHTTIMYFMVLDFFPALGMTIGMFVVYFFILIGAGNFGDQVSEEFEFSDTFKEYRHQQLKSTVN